MSAPSLPLLPDQRLAAGVARLAGRVSPETVHALLTDSYSLPATTAQVRTHPVVWAERFTVERLAPLSHVRGAPGSGFPRVPFVCSRNAGRSQPATALLAPGAMGRLTVSSAGTHPAGEVEPFIAQVLTEADVDAAGAFPKPPTDEVVQAADTVITMGSGDACPVVSGRRCLDWPVADPDGASLTAVRGIRDVIDAHIADLPSCLPA